jgi:hypothetical protein
MRESVRVKWSKRENDWVSRFPEWENRNARIVGNAFFTMIERYEHFRLNDWQGNPTEFKDLRTYLFDAGFDPDSFTISVKARHKK